MTTSQQLLADFVENGSDTAFSELVTRYIDLVFSTALRLLGGDIHRAQDAAQTVFIDLALQARRLSPDTMLGGWLHRDTCFVVSKMMRSERRRLVRERHAAEMNLLNQSDTNLAQLTPVLDEAINELEEEDRKAILLRFYERLNLRSVGKALGSSEDAAQKRVSRALHQLRSVLTSRGIALSAPALGTALTGEAVRAAPAGLAVSIAGTALKAAVGAGVIPLGVFKAVGLTKIKISTLGVLAVISVTIPIIMHHRAQTRLREEDELLHRQLIQNAQLAEENQQLSNLVVQARSGPSLEDAQVHELLRLRGEVGRLRQEKKEIEALRMENRQLHLAEASVVNQDSNPAAPTPSPLYTRVLKVNAEAVVAHLNGASAEAGTNSTQDPFHQAALRHFLNGLGVEIEPPATAFMDDTNGTLIVHSSLENLDKIEQAFSVLNLGGK